MKKSSNDEIIIPEPINRKKEDNKKVVEHPTKIKTEEKISVNKFKNRSRFEVQAVPVEVPSKGFLYKNISKDPEVQNGIIRLSPMTSEEEKILTTQRFIEQGIALDMILESCIKSDIDPYDLLSSDRLYLLFYLRGMSYSLDYNFDVKCYKCGKSFVQKIEINKLPLKVWESEEDAKEPFEVELPITKAVVEGHFMRGREEKELTEKSKSLKSFDEADDRATNSLIYLIDKVTLPDGEVLNNIDKNDFIKHLIAGDCDEFRTKLNEYACGIKQLENITCPHCLTQIDFNVPLGREFFRRSRR
jgi:hypothetical protein